MTLTPPTSVRNWQAVVEWFGYWPSFHGAKVCAYTGPAAGWDSVDLTLHTWELTSEVDASGFYVLRKHVLIRFRFAGVGDAQMERFDSGNILFELLIIEHADDSSLRVELDSATDMSGSFAAASGEVVSVIPCTSAGEPI